MWRFDSYTIAIPLIGCMMLACWSKFHCHNDRYSPAIVVPVMTGRAVFTGGETKSQWQPTTCACLSSCV